MSDSSLGSIVSESSLPGSNVSTPSSDGSWKPSQPLPTPVGSRNTLPRRASMYMRSLSGQVNLRSFSPSSSGKDSSPSNRTPRAVLRRKIEFESTASREISPSPIGSWAPTSPVNNPWTRSTENFFPSLLTKKLLRLQEKDSLQDWSIPGTPSIALCSTIGSVGTPSTPNLKGTQIFETSPKSSQTGKRQTSTWM